MDYLLFSGPQTSGKTPSIRKFAEHLIYNLHYRIIDPVAYHIPLSGDIKCILEKAGKQVMLVSETDQITSINVLYLYHEANPNVDIIITASRDQGDRMRDYLFYKLDIKNPANTYFEIPLGRMVRGGRRTHALSWYLDSLQEVAKKIGAMPPYSF